MGSPNRRAILDFGPMYLAIIKKNILIEENNLTAGAEKAFSNQVIKRDDAWEDDIRCEEGE